MGFNALIDKVHQAEAALEARERQTAADWRRTRRAFRAFWTPGRLVIAGLASGFLFGKAEPFKKAAAGGTLQLISALGSLFAGGGAQAAAEDAEDAAAAAQRRPAARPAPPSDPPAPPEAPARPAQARPRAETPRPPYEVPETFRDSGQL